MPEVSVLMPVYNTRPEHLREAMESILAQTFTDFEFLILNDASSDPRVEEVVQSFSDPRIVYAVNEKNLGISGSRNRLLDMAKGEYLAVMDHDDISLPVGKIRVRPTGSAGGHNGIKNIIAHLGTQEFQRIRVGVGEKPKEYDLAAYVLGRFTAEDRRKVEEAFADAADAVSLMVRDETNEAMNRYNRKKAQEPKTEPKTEAKPQPKGAGQEPKPEPKRAPEKEE